MSRPTVLDEIKRREVCALFAAGVSRRAAARYVNCAPATIRNCIDRDEEFRHAVAQAQMTFETGCLGAIRNAGANHWRAAAWLLEKTHPERYGPAAARKQKPARETVDKPPPLTTAFFRTDEFYRLSAEFREEVEREVLARGGSFPPAPPPPPPYDVPREQRHRPPADRPAAGSGTIPPGWSPAGTPPPRDNYVRPRAAADNAAEIAVEIVAEGDEGPPPAVPHREWRPGPSDPEERRQWHKDRRRELRRRVRQIVSGAALALSAAFLAAALSAPDRMHAVTTNVRSAPIHRGLAAGAAPEWATSAPREYMGGRAQENALAPACIDARPQPNAAPRPPGFLTIAAVTSPAFAAKTDPAARPLAARPPSVRRPHCRTSAESLSGDFGWLYVAVDRAGVVRPARSARRNLWRQHLVGSSRAWNCHGGREARAPAFGRTRYGLRLVAGVVLRS